MQILNDRPERPVVAIIGAGFSGIMAAIHLLRLPQEPLVRLIERRESFGLGTAYSTTSSNHLLNVRARNMSALPDEPNHFIAWLAETRDDLGADGFVRRATYGAYLQSLLRTVIEEGVPGRLMLEADEAVSLKSFAGGWRIGLAMGRSMHADAVILALGNLPPHLPSDLEENAESLPENLYIRDPWRADISSFPHEGTVLLLGTGLTAVDVALDIASQRPRLRQLALSRRGLLPRPHGLNHGSIAFDSKPEGNARTLLRCLREQVTENDWRSVIDAIRPYVSTIWTDWSLSEKRQFLRHLVPWWDVHRHRLAPKVAERLRQLIADGILEIAAGRLLRVEGEAGASNAVWRERGTGNAGRAAIVRLINCTGPNGMLGRSDDPLIKGLHQDGFVRQDALGLGVEVDLEARVIKADGDAHATLFAIGPVARGTLWEITSVPDIRVQAAKTAEVVMQSLGHENAYSAATA